MSLNAWTRELGTQQGRLAPVGAAPSQGTKVFVLGFDNPGRFEQFEVGDYAQVSQTATFGGSTKLVRVHATLRPPTSMPAGLAWKLTLRIDSIVYASQLLTPGRTRDRSTLAANIAHLSPGARVLALRLELVSV